MNEQYTATLEMLMPMVVDKFIERNNSEPNETIEKIYASETYSLLEKEQTKMWHFSPVTLCGILEREFSGKPLEIPVEG